MIERSLYNWMETVNPLVSNLQAPFEGPRPASPYLTYQIISLVPERIGYKETVNEAKNVVTYYGTAAMRVSINAYAPNGYDLLSRLHQSKRHIDSRLALRSDDEDLSLLGAGNIQNLTALGDESWRSRFQADFNFLVTIKSEWAFYRIRQWNLTGEWATADRSRVIEHNHIAPKTPIP